MLLTVTIEPTFAKVGASPVPLPCLKVSGAKFNHFSLNSCFYGSLGKGNGPVSLFQYSSTLYKRHEIMFDGTELYTR